MKKGFTLIELILYVTILGIVMTALLPVALAVVDGGAKNSQNEEVVSTARNVMERIKYQIRNARDISAISAGSLTLTNYSGPDTVIDLSAGKVRINQGTGAVALNSEDTLVTQLVFSDYRSADGNTKNVQIQMTVTDNSASSRQEYMKTIQLQTSVEIRGI